MGMLVVGDIILDRYWFGVSSRLSPEAPVPIVDDVREEWRLGGAANVARQLRALGEDVLLAGAVGADAPGERVSFLLAQEGIDAALITERGRKTTLKHRIIANDHQIARVDDETRRELDEAATVSLLGQLTGRSAAPRAVVLSDYSKGVVTPLVARGVIDGLGGAAPVVVDTKARALSRFARAAVLTPNEMELRRATGCDDLEQAARTGLAELDGGAILVTQGARGMTLWCPDAAPVQLCAAARHVADVTGAGDTVTGVLAWALSRGWTLERAAGLANAAAGVTVGEIGNGMISRAELGLLDARIPAPRVPEPAGSSGRAAAERGRR